MTYFLHIVLNEPQLQYISVFRPSFVNATTTINLMAKQINRSPVNIHHDEISPKGLTSFFSLIARTSPPVAVSISVALTTTRSLSYSPVSIYVCFFARRR
jgi:hypothetical protein